MDEGIWSSASSSMTYNGEKVDISSTNEHPQIAKSWEEPAITDFFEKDGVHRVTGDQCMYGLKTKDGDRVGPARKSTGFMSNSPCIAQALSQRCPSIANRKVHQHILFEGGRTRVAQVHPPELCRAICEGFKAQLEVDKEGQLLLAEVQQSDGNNGRDMVKTSNQ